MPRLLHHVDLTVSDLARAKRFYKPVMEYLGFRMTENTAQDLGFAPAGENSIGIVLHPAKPESRAKRHDRYAPGLHHLAFNATSRDQVDGLYSLLQQMGAVILDPPAVYYPPDYYAVFFADPDGLKLELVHHPAGH
jgi:glyoxylase I family protein